MTETGDNMQPEYDFSHGERGKYTERMRQGFTTPVSRGEQQPTGIIEIIQDSSGHWRWRLKAANHQVIAVSSETFATQQECHASIDAMYHAMARIKTINADAA